MPGDDDLAVLKSVSSSTPFDGWTGVPGDLSGADNPRTKTQFMYTFQRDGALGYYEAGDTDDLWATTDTTAPEDHVKTAGFEFVGASSLAAAASAMMAASLLF